MIFKGQKTTWYRPTTLSELLELKSEYPIARIVVGNTEIGKVFKRLIKLKSIMTMLFLKIGVETKFKDCRYPVMIQPNKIAELNVFKKCVKGLIVGAAVTIDRLEHELKQLIDTMPGRYTILICKYFIKLFIYSILHCLYFRL